MHRGDSASRPPLRKRIKTEQIQEATATISPSSNIDKKNDLEQELLMHGLTASLSASQHAAFKAVTNSKDNVFITGAAGTGKSHLLGTIFVWASYLYGDEFAMLSYSGVAVQNLAAICHALAQQHNVPYSAPINTIHSYFRLPFSSPKPNGQLHASVQRRLKKTRFLVIDEISMVDPKLLNHLDTLCRRARNWMKSPFGGIQVIFCGDFAQLPPIPPRNPSGIKVVVQPSTTFAFQSDAWKKLAPKRYDLDVVFRQQQDPDFIALLHRARFGQLTASDNQLLLSRKKPHDWHPSQYMRIDPNRIPVQLHNEQCLARLQPETEVVYAAQCLHLVRAVRNSNTFEMEIAPGSHPAIRAIAHSGDTTRVQYSADPALLQQVRQLNAFVFDQLEKQLLSRMAPMDQPLRLRQFSRVAYCINDFARGLANGSVGTVVDFTDMQDCTAYCRDAPLASAVKEHFGLRMIGDNTRTILSASNSSILSDDNNNDMKDASAAVNVVEPSSRKTRYPIVNFGPRIGIHTIYDYIRCEIDEDTGAVLAYVQPCLAPAFAWTSHRAQGITIRDDKIHLDLNHVFCSGQAYVCLSRACSLEQVTLEPPSGNDFTRLFFVNDCVKQFYHHHDQDNTASILTRNSGSVF